MTAASRGGSSGGGGGRRRTYALLIVFVVVASTIFLGSIFLLQGGDQEGALQHLRVRLRNQHLEHQLELMEQKLQRSPDVPPAAQQAALSPHNMPDATSMDWDRIRREAHRYHMRYWLETMPSWPASPLPQNGKFVSFTPWEGGFNNIRMSLEQAAAFALATDRTLVLPPRYRMYLRGESSFQDYFDFDDLKRGLRVVDYFEFRRLVDLQRYDGHGVDGPESSKMKDYYEGISKMPDAHILDKSRWKDLIASQIVYCFPACPNQTSSSVLKEWFNGVAFRLKPMEGGAPEITNARVVHFPANLLGHFYTFVWFRDDPRRGAMVKRVIRDHVHFKEEIFAFAERIIQALGGDFAFSCLHVRRNDFQFEDVRTLAPDIVRNMRGLIQPNETVYIATDELSKGDKKVHFEPDAMAKVESHAWFKPMFEAWSRDKVRFWSDFHDQLGLSEVKKIWIGCVESVVCTRARNFVGTQKSTFTGYIHRMRGYMRDVGQKELFEAQARYPEDYYKALVGPTWSRFPHGTYGGGHPYWGREYKEAWDGINDPLY